MYKWICNYVAKSEIFKNHYIRLKKNSKPLRASLWSVICSPSPIHIYLPKLSYLANTAHFDFSRSCHPLKKKERADQRRKKKKSACAAFTKDAGARKAVVVSFSLSLLESTYICLAFGARSAPNKELYKLWEGEIEAVAVNVCISVTFGQPSSIYI